MVTPRDIGWWEYYRFYPPLTLIVYLLIENSYLTWKVSLMLLVGFGLYYVLLVGFDAVVISDDCMFRFYYFFGIESENPILKSLENLMEILAGILYIMLNVLCAVFLNLLLIIFLIQQGDFSWYIVIASIEIVARVCVRLYRA